MNKSLLIGTNNQSNIEELLITKHPKLNGKFKRLFNKYGIYYLFVSPALILTFLLAYLPLPGLLLAFKDYDLYTQPNMLLGIFESPWAEEYGLANILNLFREPAILTAIWNTLWLNFLSLVISFPAPIILALLLNEVKNGVFKKITQTVSYLPHFLSWLSVIGIMISLFQMNGLINEIRVSIFGAERIMYMGRSEYFLGNYLLLTVWKDIGWGSIIYLATLAGVSPNLYEAAAIDGANKWKQMQHITLPALIPTMMLLLILRLGQLFGSNFELVYGLQNAFVNFEVISTLVYKRGIGGGGQYPMATALGFVQGVVAFLLTAFSNKFSKWLSGVSIW